MRIDRKNSPFYFVTILALGLFLVVAIRFGEYPRVPFAHGGAGQNVSGFAWSQTIGWISFNCLDSSGASSPQQNTCATADYGVNIEMSTGNFSGFAWSSSFGYINFSPTPDAATGCTASPCARLDGATNNVSGWARACDVLAAADCTGTTMKSSQALGGWDGWIKLSDPSWANPANYGYLGSPGVVYDAGGHNGIYFDPASSKLKGFAWGGLVVGWVDFAPVVPPGAGGVFVNLPPPGISVTPIQLDFGNVEVATSRTLAFSVTNTGAIGSLLSGTVTVPSGTSFTISSGNAYVTCTGSTSCTYNFIPSSSSGLLNVTFTPPAASSGETTQVTFSSGGALADVAKTVFGNGVYLVSSSGLNFGNVVIGKTKDLVLTIQNNGSLDLGSDNLSFPFPVYTCVFGCPFNLPPGASVNATIRFTPTAVAVYNGNAYLTAHPSVTFPFTGNGVTASFKFKDQ